MNTQDIFTLINEAKKDYPNWRVSVSFSCDHYDSYAHAFVYPHGLGRGYEMTSANEGETILDLLNRAIKNMIEAQERHENNLIKYMTLKIIELADDDGICTSRQLNDHFSRDDILQHMARASNLADLLAGKTPFTVQDTGPGNLPF